MATTPTRQDDSRYSEQEARRRFERLVKAALNTPPKPLKSLVRKGRRRRRLIVPKK